MTEQEQAAKIANDWLDFKMNSLVQMVPGDPDCDACVLARQYIRLSSELDQYRANLRRRDDFIGEHRLWDAFVKTCK